MPPSIPPTDRIIPPVPKKSRLPLWFFLLGLTIGIAVTAAFPFSQTQVKKLAEIFKPPVRPYAAYAEALEKSKVAQSGIGKAWIEAGINALNDSNQIIPPYLETGYISPTENKVISYRILPRQGQLLSIRMDLISVADSPQVFIELFEFSHDQPAPQLVAFADSNSYILEYEVEEDEMYLLRIQPELLARFSYQLKIVLGASLAFPVEGKDSKAVRSFWGDSRDGGRRTHKGIDIFAKKGTPVLAATDGRIRSVREGGLGGKVVWQRDPLERYTLYYAHLDTQWVKTGQIVKAGDTLGLVGNTGNARSTPSHLHFGIYKRRRGAVDPFPFVHQTDKEPPPIAAADTGMLQWYRTRENTLLRTAPSAETGLSIEITAGTPVQCLSANGNWYYVRLPEGQRGFVNSKALGPNITPFLRTEADRKLFVLDFATEGVIKDSIMQGTEFEILAQSAAFQYIRTPGGETGFLRR